MSAPLVTTLALDAGPAHDVVRVWTRGGLAGSLTFVSGDGRAWCEAVALALRLEATTNASDDPTWARRVARASL